MRALSEMAEGNAVTPVPTTYKQRSDARRQQALDALAQLDEKLGLR